MTYFELSLEHTDPARLKNEREKARRYRKTNHWLRRVNQGLCHYCGGKFASSELTLDHVLPLARGGQSTPGNMVPACLSCNQKKQLHTPAELLLG